MIQPAESSAPSGFAIPPARKFSLSPVHVASTRRAMTATQWAFTYRVLDGSDHPQPSGRQGSPRRAPWPQPSWVSRPEALHHTLPCTDVSASWSPTGADAP